MADARMGDLFDVTNITAIVSSGASGIVLASARVLARPGANIIPAGDVLHGWKPQLPSSNLCGVNR